MNSHQIRKKGNYITPIYPNNKATPTPIIARATFGHNAADTVFLSLHSLMSEPVILLPRSYLQQGLSRELTPIVKVFMPGIIPKLKLIWHNMLYKVKY